MQIHTYIQSDSTSTDSNPRIRTFFFLCNSTLSAKTSEQKPKIKQKKRMVVRHEMDRTNQKYYVCVCSMLQNTHAKESRFSIFSNTTHRKECVRVRMPI